MVITVRGNNDILSKKEIKNALVFFGNELLGSRLSNNIYIELKNCDLPQNDMGFCNPLEWDYRPREFEILLNRTMNRKDQYETLAHEMVHVKQYARNEWKIYDGDNYKWQGKKIYMPWSKYKYMPWEIEAKKYEPILLRRYEEFRELI